MFYKLQYRENGIFIDMNYSNENLDEIRKYLESIRENGIIYRIYSVRYESIKKQEQPKINIEIKTKQTKIKKIKIDKQIKPKKYLNRINRGP